MQTRKNREKIINMKVLIKLILVGSCFVLFFHNTVFAINSKEEKPVTPGNLKEWNDGAEVTKEASGKADTYQVNVKADTTGLEKDYYSVYIYDDTRRQVKSYDGIRFEYSNESNSELKINVTLTQNSKTSVTMTENSFAIIEANDTDTPEVIRPEYGTLRIPPLFKGMIYVPFSQLYTEEGETISLASIQSFGITTVLEENQIISYSIGNIAFLEGSIEEMIDTYYLITLSGDETIVLPNTGSVMLSYDAEVIDLEGNSVDTDVTFFMEEDIEGIVIQKDGTLEIQSNSVASQLTLYAKTSQSINAGKLELSLERVSLDVSLSGIPKEEDVKSITSAAYARLNESVVTLRILALGIALLLGYVFISWLSRAKANYLDIKKKLHKLYDEEEES